MEAQSERFIRSNRDPFCHFEAFTTRQDAMTSQRCRGLTIERCEPRLCLTGIGFAHHSIEPHGMGASRGMTVADLDEDGDLDLVAEFFSKGGLAGVRTLGATRFSVRPIS